jgi:hypothetical protein
MLDRYITTRMSANIVGGLIKSGWTASRIASAIKAPLAFVEGVQAKRQVLSFNDIRVLAARTRYSPHLMLLNAVPPSEMNPELKALFASTRQALEASQADRTPARKRRSRSKAA